MASDRAARVAGRVCHAGSNGDVVFQDKLRAAIASAIRREVKRAVEEEREACEAACLFAGGHPVAQRIRAAIRARERK